MLEILIILGALVLDQATKLWAATTLATSGASLPIIENVFHLTYTQNRGAAFGMLQDKYYFFIIITVIALGAMVYFLVTERKKVSVWMRISLALLFAGAAGNFIDRLLLHYVRDFLDFTLINFAIFNVADACISVGAVLMILSVMFIDGKKVLSKDKIAAKTIVPAEKGESKQDAGKA